MPYIHFKTTETLDPEQQEQLKQGFGKAIECIPGKSERFLMVGLESQCSLYFGGTPGTCAIAEVKLFGKADQHEYQILSAKLTQLISDICKIPGDRIYVKYEECATWGWNGNNF